jgi:two-component system response regulator PilR (NtrC family)
VKPAAVPSLLVVDDEPDLCTLYELTLVREGYDVETAGSVAEAWALLQAGRFGAVITDFRLPDGTGLELLQRMEAAGRPEKAIVITAYGSAQGAVEALKCGAFDYLTKPVDLRQFRAVVASALGREPAAPAAAAAAPRRRPDAPPAPALQRLAGAGEAMQQVRERIAKVARSMAPVLVQGESGTGKELVARAIHELSPRAAGPFVAVNCGAIPESLLEAEFFGYRKGAFTGAAEDRDGFFQAAAGGTLFLDEIGDLPLPMQSKLLRVIQERAVRPVGAVAEAPTDVRILSATHRDLGEEVHAGRFRQDLYYRLNVIGIRLPPLRERRADLPEICAAVLRRLAAEAGVEPVPQIDDDALQWLGRYPFPGNVRELENLLQRALALSAGDRLTRADLGLDAAAAAEPIAPALDEGQRPAPAAQPAPPLPADLQAHLDGVEREILERALQRHRYNRTAAGASLGLSLRQMRYRMARLGVHAGGGGDDGERGDAG